MRRVFFLLVVLGCMWIRGIPVRSNILMTDGDSMRVEANGTTPVHMLREATYRPFRKIKKLSRITRVEYRYCRGNLLSPEILIMEYRSPNVPRSLSCWSHPTRKTTNVEISFEERLKGIKDVLEEMSKTCDMSRFQQMSIDPLGFGEASVEICKRYEDYLVQSGDSTGGMLIKLYKESRMLQAICNIMRDYNLEIDDFFVEEIYPVSREQYVAYYGCRGSNEALPKKFYCPWTFMISFKPIVSSK